MIEVETPQEIEVVSNGIDVEARSLDVEVVDLKELDVTVAKREFVITGDGIYVPKLYEDAPQWMKDLVQIVVNSAMDTGNASTLAQLASMLSQFATSYVPLNQYTQSILDLSNEDASIHTIIETLNSNYSDGLSQANGQIISLQNTKASKDEVVTQVVNTLASQLANPTSSLGAAIGNLQQTIVNNQNANALSMQTLTASLESVSGDVASNAEVIDNALAYVGINEAGASTGTGLSAYLQGSNGVIGGADSKVANSVYVDAQGNNYSKWVYNSTVSLNGVNYNSGFGLSNSTGTGIGSEFWINADKLKFTNNGKTGSKAPFTIEASGSTPQITFNGVVNFSNISNVPQLGSTPQQVVDDINNGQTTTINGGRITTGSISANQIAAGSITADRINTDGLVADDIRATTISGKTITGGLVSGSVISSAYFDLSQGSKYMTNYHISPALYNSNPSAFTAAEYISALGEYRIITSATVQERQDTVVRAGGPYYYSDTGRLVSYNTGNQANAAAAKIRPVFSIGGDNLMEATTSYPGDWSYHNQYGAQPAFFEIAMSGGIGSLFSIELQGWLASYSGRYKGSSGVWINFSSPAGALGTMAGSMTVLVPVNIFGTLIVSIEMISAYDGTDSGVTKVTVRPLGGMVTCHADWTGGNFYFNYGRWVNSVSTSFKSISINNLV